MRTFVQAVLTACLLSTLSLPCQGYLSDAFNEEGVSKIVWITDCQCDCPDVNTVHEDIRRSNNASTLLLSVSQPCQQRNVPMDDIYIHVDDTGLLYIDAEIENGDKTSIAKQYQIPPVADIDLITAKYTAEHVLEVTIPARRKSTIKMRQVVVEEEGYKTEDHHDNGAPAGEPQTPGNHSFITDKTDKTKEPPASPKDENKSGGFPDNKPQTKSVTALQAVPAKAMQVFDSEKPIKDLDVEKAEKDTKMNKHVAVLKQKLPPSEVDTDAAAPDPHVVETPDSERLTVAEELKRQIDLLETQIEEIRQTWRVEYFEEL